MKNIYLFLCALLVSAVSFGQTIAINQPLTATTIPDGWTQTGTVSFPGTGAIFATGGTHVLNSPVFDCSTYSSTTIDFEYNKQNSSGNTVTLIVQYSINGAAYSTAGSVTPTSAAWVSGSVTIPTSGTNVTIRFGKTTGNRTIGLRNIVVTGTGTCGAYALPFTEGFENGVPAGCWTSFRGTNGLGTVYDWTSSALSASGSAAAYVRYESGTGGTNEDWLVTPAINLSTTINNTITFKGAQQYTDPYGTVYKVKVSTSSQTNRATFVDVATYAESDFELVGTGYSTKSIVLPAIYNTGTVYVAFVMSQDDGDNWFIDDVSVTGTVNCTAPTDQATAYNTTNINSPSAGNATLNWTRGVNGGDNVLVVMRQGSAVNADPASGTSYAANPAFGSGDQIGTGNFVVYNGPATTVNVTNLGLDQTYHVAVYEYNNTSTCYNTTELTGNFFVPCVTLSVPFNEGFEGGALPSCWTVENTVGATNWIYAAGDTNAITSAHSGSYNARLYYPSYTTPFPVTKLVTPALDLTNLANPTLSFWHAQALWSPDQDELRVYYKTSLAGSWTLIPGQTYTNSITAWTQETVVLPNPSADYYIAFEGTAKYGRGVILDDVSVTGTVIYTYDNAWIPSSPIGVSTTSNDIIIANGNAVFTGTTQSKSITVNPTGAVTVNSGATLSSANGMTLQSTSTEYSSLLLDGTFTGTVNYSRHVNGYNTVGVGTGNDLISAPVTSASQNFGVFAGANTNLRADPNNANRKLFGPFSKTTGTYLLWDTTVNGGEILTAGVGYRAATQNNGNLIFTGTPLSGNVIVGVDNSGPQFATYNLIGNPYTSYLNVNKFLDEDLDGTPGPPFVRNIDLMVPTNAAIYGYDGTAADGWVIYNLLTPTTVNMTPGQGFLVTATATSNMTFTPTMRSIDTTDDLIPGRRADANSVHVKLQAAIGASNYMTDIYFDDNCSSGLDVGYDAGVYGSNASSTAIYSHLVQNNTGVDMAIQSLAYADLGTDIIVPLGINVPQGQQVTVSIAESDLPSNIEVYLEDNVTGTFTLLNTNDYIFTPSSNLTDTGRFFLRFSDSTLSTPETNTTGLEIYTTTTPRALFINGLLASATTLNVYDLQGRVVLASTLNGGSYNNQVEVSSLSSGVYVVKLNNSSQQKTQKVILK